MLKRIEKLLVHVIGTIVAIYATIVLLFSLSAMQRKLAEMTADVLSDTFHSKVDIGSVNLGFLNRVIVNDLVIYEPSGKEMLTAARVSASINLLSLISGQIDIGTAQLFGVKATLCKATPESEPNYQFLIDALSSEESNEPSKINLHLGTLIMRHANVRYDVKSMPVLLHSLDANHVHLKDCGMNLAIHCLKNDTVNMAVKRLRALEETSGLKVKDLQLALAAGKSSALLTDFRLETRRSELELDTLALLYPTFEADSAFSIRLADLKGKVAPSDFAPIMPQLSKISSTIHLAMAAHGDEKSVKISRLNLSTEEDDLYLGSEITIDHAMRADKRGIKADVSRLYIDKHMMKQLADMAHWSNDSLINNIAHISYIGNINIALGGKKIASAGELESGAGKVAYDMTLAEDKWLKAAVKGDSINIGKIAGNMALGTTSFDLEAMVNTSASKPLPEGEAKIGIRSIFFKGYNYQNISATARSTAHSASGTITVDDENVSMKADLAYSEADKKGLKLNMLLERLHISRLQLMDTPKIDNLSFSIDADVTGADLKHLYGHVDIDDLHMVTDSAACHVGSLNVRAEKTDGKQSRYTITSDFMHAKAEGEVAVADIAASITNQLARHLPALFSRADMNPATAFAYEATLTDAPVLHRFTDADFSMVKPVRLFGHVDAKSGTMTAKVDMPCVMFNGEKYDNVAMACTADATGMNVHAMASTFKESADEEVPSEALALDVTADVHDNRITSDVYLNTRGRNNITLQLLPVVQLKDSLGRMKTDVSLRRSHAVINDTTWTVSPAHVSVYGSEIECRHVKFANDNANSYLTINGKASKHNADSLVAKLNDIEIKYILSMIDFDAVRFAGKTSGSVVVKNALGGGAPDLNANITVKNLSVQEGVIGDASITARWDKAVDGISVNGRMVDLFEVPEALTGRSRRITGITTVDGWISPAKNDILLKVNTMNTNAKFLHGFLGGVFKEIDGYVNGPVSIVGPLNNINIVGEAVPYLNLTLRATNVPYHIEGDTIKLRPYLFDFSNVGIYDRFGHRSTLNGKVTHRNMKNFKYGFDVQLKNLLAYDEKEFNSDKFLATVFADGKLTIDGSDGHPLYVNASVTPTKGSVFAYDAATPDAIMGNSFIEFFDRDSLAAAKQMEAEKAQKAQEEQQRLAKARGNNSAGSPAAQEKDSLAILKEAKKNYNSDIFINFDINLTPACEVKLRMDNIDDGYMKTFGYAKLTAKWYNKGAFQLFGNYNIQSGSYRLYLQDIIFRDLTLQPGSAVEFNGNPFDANIHLICHHTINSVPLSDLTATTAFSQNNKAKVVCILDITGKLGNMDFKFDMDIPNVNEETRQLVRSMINSEEEMNTQMIYLLGLGRFYPNEYMRNNGGGNSGQAMNSLLSSTLSGQINQMLGNMLGDVHNWNFGSSLSTGEKGWNDLDVEGILSGRLFNEHLLINGAFGYRDNALTDQGNFIGDFEVKWRMNQNGNLYLKAYNQTNDRYFTKATLNTQGLGLSWQHSFEFFRHNATLTGSEKRKAKGKKEKAKAKAGKTSAAGTTGHKDKSKAKSKKNEWAPAE